MQGIYIDPSLFDEMEGFWSDPIAGQIGTFASVSFEFGSYSVNYATSGKGVEYSFRNIDLGMQQAAQTSVFDPLAYNRSLAESLCNEHPSINTYPGIFGGLPHLNKLRLSVSDILGQLYLTGSIEAVAKIYSPDVSEDQIKEAIAYAQDFLDAALSS